MKGGVDIRGKRKQREIETDEAALAAGPAKREHTMLTQAEEFAGTKISQWWRARRSSGKAAVFNPGGNHSGAFRLFLNKHKNIPKRLTHFQDQALLEDIEKGVWDSKRFQNNNVHYSLMNLFAAGKIDWEQKATLSDIIETSRVYGRFIPFSILSAEGEFTEAAQTHLLPFLKKSMVYKGQEILSEEELGVFRKAIMQLPESERYFFLFPDQKLDEAGSSPSRHSGLRDNFVGSVFESGLSVIKATNREYGVNSEEAALKFIAAAAEKKLEEFFDSVTTENHPNCLKYQGILKLSFGAENAFGIIDFGRQNWWRVVPRLGYQTIENIEELSQQQIRPTLSPESLHLGLVKEREHLHGMWHEYPEIMSHDDYHRKITAQIGKDVHGAVDRIILLAREIFGFRWSKDIWLLRDFDLSAQPRDLSLCSQDDMKRYITRRFSDALQAPYLPNQLENCEEQIRKALQGSLIMMDEHQHPRQIALAFVIDLVRNPQIWNDLNILNDETYYSGSPYEKLIQIAKFLDKNGQFNDNMKENVIKFSHFIQNESFVPPKLFGIWPLSFGEWDSELLSVKLALQNLRALDKEEIDSYQSVRNNQRVFLGFIRQEGGSRAPQSSNPAAAAAVAMESEMLPRARTLQPK